MTLVLCLVVGLRSLIIYPVSSWEEELEAVWVRTANRSLLVLLVISHARSRSKTSEKATVPLNFSLGSSNHSDLQNIVYAALLLPSKFHSNLSHFFLIVNGNRQRREFLEK